MIADEFWQALEKWVRENPITIDRPKGSAHPRFPDMIYPLDYGYLEGTFASDGDGIDVWVGSLAERDLQGVFLTIDVEKKDAEIKLLVGCTPEDEKIILDFMHQHGMPATLVHSHHNRLRMLEERRSVRRFSDQEVSRDVLERILETASRAPSAHNQQPWRFVVLETRLARERLAKAMGGDFRKDLQADGYSEETVDYQVERSYRRIVEAPMAVLVCLDMAIVDSYPDASRQRAAFLMAVQSVAMAGENLLLAAHAVGLGAVWMCAPLFTPQVVQAEFSLPEGWQPQGLVLIGHAEKVPGLRERRPISELSRFISD